MALVDDLPDRVAAEFQLKNSPESEPQISKVSDQELVRHVQDLLFRARHAKRGLVDQWYKNYQVLRNKTWGTGRPSHLPSPEVPEIYPIVATITAWETDQYPTFEIAPASAPFSPDHNFYDSLAQDLNVVLRSTWQVEQYDAEIEKAVWDANIYGTGFFKATWDDTRVGGLGNAILRRVDPFTLYPDPEARSCEDMSYIIEAKTMALQEMERRWPGSIKKVRDFGYTLETDESPTATTGRNVKFPLASAGAIAPATGAGKWGLPGQSRLSADGYITDDPGITVLEAWIRTPAKIERLNPITGETDEDIYDSWRCIVVAGNVVLMDEMAENVWSHGQHPYIRFVAHDLGEFWGFSMVELLTPSQISINKLLAAIEHNIWLMGNPILLEDIRAGISRTKVTNQPGQRLQKQSGTEVSWLDPPQMHPNISSELIRFYIGEMERISGLSAIVRGATPTGRNAQGVLDAVQEAAFVRIRLTLRNLERALREAGNLLASLIVEFYDSPRIVSIVGNSGEKTSLALRSRHFYMPSAAGRVPMKFQLLVDVGSSMPISPAARAAEADVLFGMGAIDGEAVLEAHRWPNRQIVVARMRELQAATGTLGEPPNARQRTGR